MKKAETDYLEKEMKRVCNTLLNNFGKMSNDEEENICRVGKLLLDRAMKLNKSRVSKSLMSWMEKTDKLMGRCRWIECRPTNIDDYRGIDIKAGNGNDDKTVIVSNTWEELAMYAGRDGHYEEFE